ncbi:MAG: hypothetical protein CSB55_03780 [Candidatus Cloacimonadota bacterium]|nr:MAG: hypothetical protein CSB55_03780 [Candidatus Cloacimonadota bacterium]
MKYFFSLCLILFLGGCSVNAGMKPGRAKNKNYVSFFKDVGLMQYFIKPAKAEADGYVFEIDYTFREGEKAVNDSITVNFSLSSDKKSAAKVKKLILSGKERKIIFDNPIIIFKDREKNLIRYTTTFPNKKKKEFTELGDFHISVKTNKKNIVFRSKGFQKQIETLNFFLNPFNPEED